MTVAESVSRNDFTIGNGSDWPGPKKGLVHGYLDWACPRTEAPKAFHLATVLVAIAAMLGRKCSVQVGDLTFYPNLYVVLVGPSGLPRKTHSIEMQRRIVARARELNAADTTYYLSDTGTPEGLLKELKEFGSGIKVLNEFGDFLRKIKKRDFMGDFAGLMTELYDCPPQYRKRLSGSAGSFTVEEPYLCILGASTRQWMVDSMEEGDIRSGFLARFLFFVADDDVQLLPITPERDPKAEEFLAEQLAAISLIKGSFVPTEAAKAVYSEWYKGHRHELKNPDLDLLSSYYGRLEGYVWKIALIFEVSINHQLTEISEESTGLAIDFVERLKVDLHPLILRDFQPGTSAKKTEKVLRFIEKSGNVGLTRSQLLKNSHLSARELTDVIQTLTAREEIEALTPKVGPLMYRVK